MADIILFSGNLMGSARVSGVVRGLGMSIRVVREVSGSGEQPLTARAVLVDLDLTLDLSELDTEVESAAHRIAFGPHVDEDKLNAARAAGWEVLTRGQFDAMLPELARRWAAD